MPAGPGPCLNPGICDLYPAEPPEENGFRGSLAELARALRFKSRDGLVVMIGGLDPTEQAPARWLANELKAPVVADATLRAPGRAGPSGPDGRGRPAEGTSARRPA